MVQLEERIPDARSTRRVTVSMVLIGLGALLVTVGPFQTWLRYSYTGQRPPFQEAVNGLRMVGRLGFIIVATGIVTFLSVFVPFAKLRVVLALVSAGIAGTVAYSGIAEASRPLSITLGVGWWLVTGGAVLLLCGGLLGQLLDL